MALQWADTFNIYGTTTALLLNGLYSATDNTALVTDPDPTATGKVAKITLTTSITDALRFPFPGGAVATMGTAFRGWLDVLPQNSDTYMGFCFADIGNGSQVGFRILSTGAIEAVTGFSAISMTGGTVIGTTTLPVIAPNSWNHFELKTTINATTGSFELRVNGATVLSLTGVNTKATANTTIAQCWWKGFRNNNAIGNTPSLFIKDFILWDTTGSFNNNFMGTVQCIDTLTDGDSSLTWTPNAGSTGFNILAHIPPQDDTSYIAAATTLTSTFTLANLPSNVSSVRGNVLKTRVRKIDAGDGNIQVGLKSGASTALGANRAITTAYTYWFDVNETDPATGAAWTPVAFNSAIFQLARTV